MEFETETWNWNLKSKLEIETWNWNLILKLETWNWNFALLWALLGLFFFLFCSMGLFLGSRSGSRTFLEPTNIDYQFLFWKYSPILLFSFRPNFGRFWIFFGSFGAIFGVRVRFKNFFGTCLHRLTTFILKV